MAHEHIQKNIGELLAKFGYTEQDIEIAYDEKTDTLWFSITSPHTRLLFSRDAEALHALNHLATKMVEQIARGQEKLPRVIVDANGFEKKKIETLKTLAHMMAERARYFKSSIDVDPMPAHDRRIIHEFLSEVADIETESEGVGPKRHVVIRYLESKI